MASKYPGPATRNSASPMRSGPRRLRQRHDGHSPRLRHAGQRAEATQQLVVHLHPIAQRSSVHYLEHHLPANVEACVHAQQLHEAAREETCSHQQDDRHCHLRHDQPAPCTLSGDRAALRPLRLRQRRAQIAFVSAKRRDHAHHQRRQR
jgi:hypothetical protein